MISKDDFVTCTLSTVYSCMEYRINLDWLVCECGIQRYRQILKKIFLPTYSESELKKVDEYAKMCYSVLENKKLKMLLQKKIIENERWLK